MVHILPVAHFLNLVHNSPSEPGRATKTESIMGTRERRQRERAEREQLFLDTARRLIREEGLLTLQMARLADACDYATGTLYQHFSSKEDLLVALAAQGSAEHARLFQRVMDWPAGTRDRMFALAVADADFAVHHPNHARLMQYVFTEVVWDNASQARQELLLECCRPTGNLVAAIVREAVEKRELDPAGLDAMEVAMGPWSLCHGMQALMHTRGLLETLEVTGGGDLLFRHVQIYLNGIGWQPRFDPTDTAALRALISRVRDEVLDGLLGNSAPAAG